MINYKANTPEMELITAALWQVVALFFPFVQSIYDSFTHNWNLRMENGLVLVTMIH